MKRTAFAATLALGASAVGCPVTGPITGPPKLADVGPSEYQCNERQPTLEPMVVEWTGTRRADLQKKLQQGLVVVSYSGCTLKILDGCTAPGKYAFGGLSKSSDTWTIGNTNELYAKLPIGAVALQGELSDTKQLELAYSLVGWFGAVLRPSLGKEDLEGTCEGATHFIRNVQVGAFRLASASKSKVGAGVAFAGASTEGAESVVREGGTLPGCKGAQSQPEPGCDVPVQLRLEPLGPAKAPLAACRNDQELFVDTCRALSTACPAGMQWDGARCAGKACPKDTELLGNECIRREKVTSVECPAGTQWNGEVCAGAARVLCPAGAQEVEGVCVRKVVVTHVDCPAGSSWNGRTCSGSAVLACPPGLDFVAGMGCVSAATQQQAARQGQAAPAVAAPPMASCQQGMVLLRGGSFAMGAAAGEGRPNELPVHNVTVRPFCMDTTEVTVAAFDRCVSARACEPASTTTRWPNMNERDKAMSRYCNGGKPERSAHPVNCVDWQQAQAFCQWAGKRLPSEEEWEFAARGTQGRRFPWGDDIPDARRLNGCDAECSALLQKEVSEQVPSLFSGGDGHPSTAPVGSFPAGATPEGILDLSGNVWEWTGSWYGAYPHPATSGTDRVYRGGGWNYGDAETFRGARRGKFDPSMKSHSVGFRCAM